MAGLFVCVECDKTLETVRHYRNDVCIPCAHETGIFDDRSDQERFEEQRRIGEERIRAERERADLEQQQAALEAEKQRKFDQKQEALRELAERELCTRRLLPFIKRVNPAYEPGWVHADICQRLEQFEKDVLARKRPRLMLFLPPRAGKSEIGSKMFPAWFLGRHPELTAVISSYSGDLASGFSRDVRNLFASQDFGRIFPRAKLSADSKSAEKWNTTLKGGLNAVGVSGSLSGKGGHILICDDPHKDREEAESETQRQKVKDWYSSTFYTRRAPGAGILIIQTRWHEDDLSGWLLHEMENNIRELHAGGDDHFDRWEVVKYPAIATEDEKYRKKGEALHPQRFPLDELLTTKSTLISRDWQALYQQEPIGEDGEYFTKGMFRYYKPGDHPPIHELRTYSAADLAISTKQTADFSVFVTVGIDRQQNIWVLDVRRGRWNALGIIDQMFEVQQMWNPELFGIETGQIELTLEPFVQKAEQERGISLRYEKLRTRGVDKAVRARPIQGRMEQGKVFFPALDSTPWMPALQNEFLKFPLGKNDDQVDALAWIGQMIMLFGIVNQKRPPKQPSWKDRLVKYGATDKKHRSPMSA